MISSFQINNLEISMYAYKHLPREGERTPFWNALLFMEDEIEQNAE